MLLPHESRCEWSDAITGAAKHEFESLALRMLLVRLNLSSKSKLVPVTIKACVRELREFFQKNVRIPSVSHDLDTLFGKEAKA